MKKQDTDKAVKSLKGLLAKEKLNGVEKDQVKLLREMVRNLPKAGAGRGGVRKRGKIGDVMPEEYQIAGFPKVFKVKRIGGIEQDDAEAVRDALLNIKRVSEADKDKIRTSIKEIKKKLMGMGSIEPGDTVRRNQMRDYFNEISTLKSRQLALTKQEKSRRQRTHR